MPEWYLTACLRALADLVRQGVTDELLARTWRAYCMSAP